MMEEFLEIIETLEKTDIEESPIYKAMVLLRAEMILQNVPELIPHIGKLDIQVDEGFFEDGESAQKVVKSYVSFLKKFYDLMMDKFGLDDGHTIFIDSMTSMSLTYKG